MTTDPNASKSPEHADAPDPPRPLAHGHELQEGEEAPPPGVRAMAAVRWLLLGLMVLATFASVYGYAAPLLGQAPPASTAGRVRYHCPMHPQITSDSPGECPICHMSLEPIPAEREAPASSSSAAAPPATATPAPPPRPKSTAAPGASASAGAPRAPGAADPAHAGYTCPMHPEVRSAEPGRCPKCGMDLVPVDGAAPAASEPSPAGPPPGTTSITLALDRVQAIGVRTALVERTKAASSLRVTAFVEAPDQGKAEVHARTDGFVEAIAVREIGVKVKAGQLLASIYSPAVYQAQEELLAVGKWAGSPGASAADAAPVAAARRKLELLGLGKAAIDRIVASGKPSRAIGVSAPVAGYVTKKNVVLGSSVTPEMTLFEIADLSKVYVIAVVAPHELGGIHVGDRAAFTTPAVPDRVFEAKVDLVYPEIDLATRTTRVRFQVDNTDLALRPGQFGTAELASAASSLLTVPLDAVIDTGRSVYVFLAKGDGLFEPRAVELGPELGGRAVVRSGVAEGERVVSGATFLIDAESRLRASFAEGARP